MRFEILGISLVFMVGVITPETSFAIENQRSRSKEINWKEVRHTVGLYPFNPSRPFTHGFDSNILDGNQEFTNAMLHVLSISTILYASDKWVSEDAANWIGLGLAIEEFTRLFLFHKPKDAGDRYYREENAGIYSRGVGFGLYFGPKLIAKIFGGSGDKHSSSELLMAEVRSEYASQQWVRAIIAGPISE